MASGRQHTVLRAGVPAPDFRLERLEGSHAELADLTAEGPVLLAFFKITCPVCQLTLPILDRIPTSALRIYGVSQNNPEDTREFASEFHLKIPILLDPEDENFPASNAYGISSVPTMFLVEKNGIIAQVVEGWSRKEIEDLGMKFGINPVREDENVPAWKAG